MLNPAGEGCRVCGEFIGREGAEGVAPRAASAPFVPQMSQSTAASNHQMHAFPVEAK